MSWSYDVTKLSENGKDAVRLLVGDTDYDDQLNQDEEIEWAISQNRNVFAAAAQIAEAIAAYFARQADAVKVGPIYEQASNRAESYMNLVQSLKEKAASRRTLSGITGAILTPPTFTKGITNIQGTEVTE